MSLLPFSFSSSPLDPVYPLYPICAFLGFVLVFIPLPWHLRAQNAGTCAYIFWAGLSCLFEFVNAVVWRDSALNVAPVWCDISTKFLLGASVGIPASALCISRRLYKIAVVKTVSISNDQKRRALIVDLCISVGIPAIVMALHVVVQGHRFDILETVGCYPAVYNTLPAYFLVFMWPVVFGCISFVYSGLTLRVFYIRRLEFTQLLSSRSTFNKSRYVRLMALAAVDMACTVPLSIYSMYLSTDGVQLEKYVSWAYVHYDFAYVGEVPAAVWMSDPAFRRSVEMTRWLYVGCALLFFVLFGMAEEARRHYKEAFVAVAKRFGWDLSAKKRAPSSVWSDQWTKSAKLSLASSSLPTVVSPGTPYSFKHGTMSPTFSASTLDHLQPTPTSHPHHSYDGFPYGCDPTSPTSDTTTQVASPTYTADSFSDLKKDVGPAELETPGAAHTYVTSRQRGLDVERDVAHGVAGSAATAYHRPFPPVMIISPSAFSVLSSVSDPEAAAVEAQAQTRAPGQAPAHRGEHEYHDDDEDLRWSIYTPQSSVQQLPV